MKKGKSQGLPFLEFGAGNEARTRDLNLGKVALYQLSYSRIAGGIERHRSAASNPTFNTEVERETRLELATSTLARLRSTN
jgi:hypothetical protein